MYKCLRESICYSNGCCKGYCCDSVNCFQFTGGKCQYCGGDPDMSCCDGECYDSETEKCCNPPGDNNGKSCTLDQCCVDGECINNGEDCSPDQCCLNGTCVAKCDPDGETCEHATPVTQAQCLWQSEDDHRCYPDEEGKICMWIPEHEYQTSAKCASCASGCRELDGFCASYKAETCRLVLFLGCMCDYDGPENERPRADLGYHYKCK